MVARSVDKEEIEKFSRMADEWWDADGKFRPLHQFNPVRIDYIKDQIMQHYDLPYKHKVLSGLSVLDIGCGGGLLSEPMCTYGADVTGIDASSKNISIASIHAKKNECDIDYRCVSVEELAKEGKQYDVLLNMEVIEHVADVGSFMNACSGLIKPGGIMFMATINRTAKAYALAIIGAEYILKWLPKGTHDWKKFLKPSEIEAHLAANDLKLSQMEGITYSALLDNWSLSDDISVNYMMVAKKDDKQS